MRKNYTVTNKSKAKRGFRNYGGFTVVEPGKTADIKGAAPLSEDQIENLERLGVTVEETGDFERPESTAKPAVEQQLDPANDGDPDGEVTYEARDKGNAWYAVYDKDGNEVGKSLREDDANAFNAMTAEEKAAWVAEHS